MWPWKRTEGTSKREFFFSSHTRHIRNALHADMIGVARHHPGYFQVRGRYPDRHAAAKALREAKVFEYEGKIYITILVPAISREHHDDDPPKEVGVFY